MKTLILLLSYGHVCHMAIDASMARYISSVATLPIASQLLNVQELGHLVPITLSTSLFYLQADLLLRGMAL